MEKQSIVDVLMYVRDKVLVTEGAFAQHNHFRRKDGSTLPVSHSSIEEVHSACIEGATLVGLWKLKLLNETQNHQSRQCYAVMCALADTLGIEGDLFAKVDGVQNFSNQEGYAATMLLVQKTIDRLS